MLATTFTSLAYQPILERARKEGRWDRSRLQRWEAAHARLDAASRQPLGQWILRSEDGGLNWSARRPQWLIVPTAHRAVQWTVALCRQGALDRSATDRSGVFEDDGRSWHWAAEIPRARETTPPSIMNCMPLRCLTAGWWCTSAITTCLMRETLQCESTDGGLSWTKPRSVGVWGLPSHLLRLVDGRAPMTYGHRRPPFGNQARLSEDGRSWSALISPLPPMGLRRPGLPQHRAADRWFAGQCGYERLANHPKACCARLGGRRRLDHGKRSHGVGLVRGYGVPSLREILFALHGDFAKDSPAWICPPQVCMAGF